MKYLVLTILAFSNLCFSQSVTNYIKKELVNPKTNGKIWVYLPSEYEKGGVPVILVPPAGTRLFHGMELSDGDSAEHIPYVENGFAVISFDLSGKWPADASETNILKAINAYVARNAGLEDVQDALLIAKSAYPKLSSSNIYIAGHSSAATIALMAAQQIPQIKAAIAYAPVIDVESYLANMTPKLAPSVQQFKTVLIDGSPHKNIQKYHSPIFLFVAKDDAKLADRKQSYKDFTAALSKAGVPITYVEVEHGGHYQSMIDEGIPAAINWLKAVDGGNKK
jgi:dipeptidyl aminopeptidase/acylaminoacyl peptidase